MLRTVLLSHHVIFTTLNKIDLFKFTQRLQIVSYNITITLPMHNTTLYIQGYINDRVASLLLLKR